MPRSEAPRETFCNPDLVIRKAPFTGTGIAIAEQRACLGHVRPQGPITKPVPPPLSVCEHTPARWPSARVPPAPLRPPLTPLQSALGAQSWGAGCPPGSAVLLRCGDLGRQPAHVGTNACRLHVSGRRMTPAPALPAWDRSAWHVTEGAPDSALMLEDADPRPPNPRGRETHRRCLYTLASGAPPGRWGLPRARLWGVVGPRFGASGQHLLTPPLWDQNARSVVAVHERGHTGQRVRGKWAAHALPRLPCHALWSRLFQNFSGPQFPEL